MAANQGRAEDRSARGIRAARRTLMYIVRVMLLLVVGALVCVLAFLTAERMSNLYILVTEGMSLRAEYILTDDVEMSELEEYFLLTHLSDHPLPSWPSRRYRIRFVNTGSRWYIAELEVVEENPAVEPLRTPDPNSTPLPMATPTPTPTATPLSLVVS